ncbi:hypothetical protein [Neisseria wadsworthii]|nr:hypothetical protein [Neisseria wadsworthii]QMT35090.1 hypothetical protein H3L96_08460 [Neisseria wadsworthii]
MDVAHESNACLKIPLILPDCAASGENGMPALRVCSHTLSQSPDAAL